MAFSLQSKRLAAAVAAVASVLTGGSAAAQSCVQQSPSLTRCRLMLSQPRTLTVNAGAKLTDARRSSAATIAIAVDGRPCLSSALVLRRQVSARCTVALTATDHLIEASVEPQAAQAQGVGVSVVASTRLAELPREAGDLYPRQCQGPLWRRVWPFSMAPQGR